MLKLMPWSKELGLLSQNKNKVKSGQRQPSGWLSLKGRLVIYHLRSYDAGSVFLYNKTQVPTCHMQ